MKKIYFDMDGVLVDFEPTFLAVSGGITHNDDSHIYRAATKLISQTEFFRDLPTHPAFMPLVFIMQECDLLGIEIHILTSLGKHWNTDRGVKTYANKVAWLKTHLDPHFTNYVFHVVPDANDKHRYGDANSFLIDDRQDNCEGFCKHGGMAHQFEGNTEDLLQDLAKFVYNTK